MTIKIEKVARKPLYSSAVQVSLENIQEVSDWCKGEVRTAAMPGKGHEGARYIKVPVDLPRNVRQTKAYVGNWILYEKNNYKVYSNDAFIATFIAVESLDEDNSSGLIRKVFERPMLLNIPSDN